MTNNDRELLKLLEERGVQNLNLTDRFLLWITGLLYKEDKAISPDWLKFIKDKMSKDCFERLTYKLKFSELKDQPVSGSDARRVLRQPKLLADLSALSKQEEVDRAKKSTIISEQQKVLR